MKVVIFVGFQVLTIINNLFRCAFTLAVVNITDYE